MAVHMHALENRAGGVPVRDYRFAWQIGVVIAEAPHRTHGASPQRQYPRTAASNG